VSFDIQAGYRHFRLAPQMRDWFLFRYDGRFYRCIALPFGWGRSPMWFTQLMVPMVRKAKATVSSSRVLGRFLDMPRQGRECSQYERLPEGDTGDRQADIIFRLHTASDEGGMGREYPGGTPWLRDRPGSHASLHSSAKECQGAWHRAGYPPSSTARSAVGLRDSLRSLCGVCVCSAARTNVVVTVMSTIIVVC
jgi:hypothetical protein